jgi:hypothetical protein
MLAAGGRRRRRECYRGAVRPADRRPRGPVGDDRRPPNPPAHSQTTRCAHPAAQSRAGLCRVMTVAAADRGNLQLANTMCWRRRRCLRGLAGARAAAAILAAPASEPHRSFRPVAQFAAGASETARMEPQKAASWLMQWPRAQAAAASVAVGGGGGASQMHWRGGWSELPSAPASSRTLRFMVALCRGRAFVEGRRIAILQ